MIHQHLVIKLAFFVITSNWQSPCIQGDIKSGKLIVS